MANTFTQIHIHVVFAVQNRVSLIQKSWQDQLYKYIITIIQKHGHKVLAIGGMSDHIHILFGFRPTTGIVKFDARGKTGQLGMGKPATFHDGAVFMARRLLRIFPTADHMWRKWLNISKHRKRTIKGKHSLTNIKTF